MRLLLATLTLGCCLAEDTLPLIDLAVDGVPPPPPSLMTSWKDAQGAAGTWLQGHGVSPTGLTGPGRWTGWMVLRDGDRPPLGALSGWCHSEGPDLTMTWPATTMTRSAGRLQVSTRGTPQREEPIAPGLTAHLHGRTLALALIADQAPPQAPVVDLLLSLIREADLTVRITADAARLTLTAPPRLTAPLDPGVTAQLPRGALVAVACGIGPASTRLSPGTATWAVLPEEGGWVASLPDGPTTRLSLAPVLGAALDKPGRTSLEHLRLWAECRDGRWWLSSVATLPTVTGTPIQVPADTRALVVLPQGLTDVAALERWPWNALDPAWVPTPRLLTWDGADTVTTTPADLPLPWLAAAGCAGWMADAVADRAGCHRLQTLFRDLAARGVVTDLAGLKATLPPVTDVAGWQQRLKDLEGKSRLPDTDEPLTTLLRQDGVPLTSLSSSTLGKYRAAIVSLEPMLALDPAVLSAIPWVALPDDGNPGSALLPHGTLLRNAASAGQHLVMAGDAQGFTAIERALRVASHPRTYIEYLFLASIRAIRNQTLVAMAVQGMPLPAGALAEDTIDDAAVLRRVWQGEVIVACWLGRQVLEDHLPEGRSSVSMTTRDIMHRFVHSRALLAPAWHAGQADTVAQGIAGMATALDHPEQGPAPVMLPKPLAALTFPASLGDFRLRAVIGHHLSRLFLRCLAVSAQSPPNDTAAMATRLGQPLAIPVPGGSLPCTWTVLPNGARILALDLTGPRPAGVSESVWASLGKQKRPAADDRLFTGMTVIQVCPPRPPANLRF